MTDVSKKLEAIKARQKAERDARTRAPQGPSEDPHIPIGHELRGVSSLVGPNGELRARWDKTGLAGAETPPVEVPPDWALRKTSMYLGADGSVRGQHVTYTPEEVDRHNAFVRACDALAERYAGLAPPAPAPVDTHAELLSVIPLGDPHLGLLSWKPETGVDFDTRIAVRELSACVQMLIDASAPAHEAILCNLGDFFHAQDEQQRTPGSGHKLDVDTRHAKIFEAGLETLVRMIDGMLRKHNRVNVFNIPGNHDPEGAFRIACVLGAWYRNEPRVYVDRGISPFAFHRHGKNLLGFAHGDGAKTERLVGVMTTDQAQAWGETEFRVWHCGHVHHRSVKEFPGCVIETHRTMAARDAWHNRMGYRSAQSLSAIAYHATYGEVSRITVGLARVRAALAGAT